MSSSTRKASELFLVCPVDGYKLRKSVSTNGDVVSTSELFWSDKVLHNFVIVWLWSGSVWTSLNSVVT